MRRRRNPILDNLPEDRKTAAAIVKIDRARRHYDDYLLWSLEFYTAADLFAALEAQGCVYAANQDRWLMQLSFV